MNHLESSREEIIRYFFMPRHLNDISKAYNLLADDVIVCEPRELPWGGCYRGLEGLGAMMANMSRNVVSELAIEEVISCGKKVVVNGQANGKVLASGRQFKTKITQLYTFNKEGKISRIDLFCDIPSMHEALCRDVKLKEATSCTICDNPEICSN